MEPAPECELCEGTGTMTWQQPVPTSDGGWALTQRAHPCVNGCSGWWQMPAAECGGVVDPGTGITTGGNVAQVNSQLRTEWSLAPHQRPLEPPR